MADSNPWSAEGWNVTGQSQYMLSHGTARAAARARDAGTTLGGPRPLPAGAPAKARRFAEVAVVRPSNPPIYRFMIPMKRPADDDLRIVDDGAIRDTTEADDRQYRD